MGLTINSYLSIFSVVVSITALALAYLKFSQDNPKIGFSWELGANCVQVIIFNTGRRPIFIKSVGVFEWTEGTYFFGANKSVDKILNEAESISVEEPYNLATIWKIKKFVALDHNNKIWVASRSQMKSLYEVSHVKPYRTIEGSEYLTSEGIDKKWDKLKIKMKKKRKSSIKKYRRYAKRYHFKPRV